MSDLSNYAFTGRLTRDAEYRTLPTGKALLTMPVAVNTGFGDYKKTTFIKVQQWGERGSKIVDYLKKGKLVAGSGVLTTNEYDGKDGVHHVEVIVDVGSISFYDTQGKSTGTDPTAAPISDIAEINY